MGKQIPVPHNAKAAFLAGFLFCCLHTMACQGLWRGVHSVNSSPGPFVEAIQTYGLGLYHGGKSASPVVETLLAFF